MNKLRIAFITAVMTLISAFSYAQQDSTQVQDSTVTQQDTIIVVNTFPPDDIATPAPPPVLPGPDSTKVLRIDWEKYASNDSLTYREIVTICDSLFARSGQDKIPVTGDEEDDEAAGESTPLQ